MATTSGTYAWSPTIADLMSEAWERIGLDPDSLTARDINSAFRSFNLLLAELENYDADSKFRLDRGTLTTTASEPAYQLPAGTLDILQVTKRQNAGTTSQSDTPIQRTTRADYVNLSPKESEASIPSQWWVNFENPMDPAWFNSDPGSNYDRPAIIFYPVPDAAYTFIYDRIRTHQDVNSLNQLPDTRRNWMPALASGLAWQLSKKYNRALSDTLAGEWIAERNLARRETRSRGDTMVYARGFGRTRRRRF